MASFPDDLGKCATERLTNLNFNEARDDRVAEASAGPYTFAPHSKQITMPALHHLIFEARCSS